MKTVLILLTFSIYCHASTEELTPLKTPAFTYHSGVSEHFELYLEALRQGYPLGKVESENSSTSSEKLPALSEILVGLQTSIEDLERSSNAVQKGYTQSLEEPKSEITKVNVPHQPELAAVEKIDLNKFVECSNRSLSLLKSRLRAEQLQDEVAKELVESELRSERGDGGKIGGDSGMPCGKHLGPLSAASRGTVEDIKTLSCLSISANSDLKKVLFTFYALRANTNSGNTYSAHPFWATAWKAACLKIVMHNQALDAKDVVEAFSRQIETPQVAKVGNSKGIFKVDAKKLTKVLLKEWEETVVLVGKKLSENSL